MGPGYLKFARTIVKRQKAYVTPMTTTHALFPHPHILTVSAITPYTIFSDQGIEIMSR